MSFHKRAGPQATSHTAARQHFTQASVKISSTIPVVAGDALLAARRRIHELEGRLRASAASRQVLQGQVATLEQQQARHAAALNQERLVKEALQDQLTNLGAELADGQARPT